jgi:hypothetical protein
MRYLRAALIALIGFWTIRLGTGAQVGCFLDLVNLAFHEAGHIVLAPFGETAHFLGGTLGQLAVPAGLTGYFLVRRRQPFAAAVCAWWVGENLVNIAVYMADARTLGLDLVGGGEHDWNILFYQFGLLGEESVARISSLTHGLGVLLMFLGLAWAGGTLLPDEVKDRIAEASAGRGPVLRYLLESESEG